MVVLDWNRAVLFFCVVVVVGLWRIEKLRLCVVCCCFANKRNSCLAGRRFSPSHLPTQQQQEWWNSSFLLLLLLQTTTSIMPPSLSLWWRPPPSGSCTVLSFFVVLLLVFPLLCVQHGGIVAGDPAVTESSFSTRTIVETGTSLKIEYFSVLFNESMYLGDLAKRVCNSDFNNPCNTTTCNLNANPQLNCTQPTHQCLNFTRGKLNLSPFAPPPRPFHTIYSRSESTTKMEAESMQTSPWNRERCGTMKCSSHHVRIYFSPHTLWEVTLICSSPKQHPSQPPA